LSVWNGRRDWIDLEKGKIRSESIDETTSRKWGGMRGLAIPVLMEKLDREVDPLGPGNPLIIASGLLTGLAFHGVPRYGMYARSPLTGAYGESEAGGYFGPSLKAQGIDGIVLEEISEKPVYIWIEKGKVEIRDASHLWGLETGPALEKLRKEHGKITAILIGPAGENQVRYACVLNDLHHANGRTGMGAVMGSKKVKAIVCPMSGPMSPADGELLKEMHNAFSGWKDVPLSWNLRVYGTTSAVEGNNESGMLPTRNFREGVFEGAENVGGIKMTETLLSDRYGCFSCAVRCKRVVKGGRYDVDPSYGGPEYETLGSFGPLCGIDDLEAVAKAHELCNRYGLDTISTGSTIAWLMECVEEGILSKEDAGVSGFGDVEGMHALVEKIAFRKGIGADLAEGVRRASEKIGGGSEKFALHVKGQELPMHDPRGKVGISLAYALAPQGADHMQFAHDTMFAKDGTYPMESVKALGILEPMDPLNLDSRKVTNVVYLWLLWSLMNHLGMCYFVFAPRSFFPIHLLPDLVKSGTGWNTSMWELMKMGERGLTGARLINVKLGLDDNEDVIPQRLFEKIPEGPLAGKSVPEKEFYEARRLYYSLLGWNEHGVPEEDKILELGLK
jgi:aldehyde:ferredoxin oxidoreductase